MAETDFFPEQNPDMDPYDREERCMKAIRTLLKAVIMRIAAGALLVFAVVRAGAAPVAVGLAVFALVIILSGMVPLILELKKQLVLRKELLALQDQLENHEQ